MSVRSTEEFLNHVWLQQLIIQELELYKEEAKHNRMETQDNGFLLVIDGVRKEKEEQDREDRNTAVKYEKEVKRIGK